MYANDFQKCPAHRGYKVYCLQYWTICSFKFDFIVRIHRRESSQLCNVPDCGESTARLGTYRRNVNMISYHPYKAITPADTDDDVKMFLSELSGCYTPEPPYGIGNRINDDEYVDI